MRKRSNHATSAVCDLPRPVLSRTSCSFVSSLRSCKVVWLFWSGQIGQSNNKKHVSVWTLRFCLILLDVFWLVASSAIQCDSCQTLPCPPRPFYHIPLSLQSRKREAFALADALCPHSPSSRQTIGTPRARGSGSPCIWRPLSGVLLSSSRSRKHHFLLAV